MISVDTISPTDIRNLMAQAPDMITLRSLAKLYDAIVTGDDLLRIEAEDELADVNLGAI